MPLASKITALLGLNYATTSGELVGSDIDISISVGVSIDITHVITDKLMAHTRMNIVEFSKYGQEALTIKLPVYSQTYL